MTKYTKGTVPFVYFVDNLRVIHNFHIINLSDAVGLRDILYLCSPQQDGITETNNNHLY